MPTMTRKLWGLLALIVVLALLIVLGPAACNRYLIEKEAGRISKGQGEATLNSLDEAHNTVANVEANEAATDEAVKQGTSEVRAAPEGQKGAAARNAACRFKANRNKPECQPKERRHEQ